MTDTTTPPVRSVANNPTAPAGGAPATFEELRTALSTTYQAVLADHQRAIASMERLSVPVAAILSLPATSAVVQTVLPGMEEEDEEDCTPPASRRVYSRAITALWEEHTQRIPAALRFVQACKRAGADVHGCERHTYPTAAAIKCVHFLRPLFNANSLYFSRVMQVTRDAWADQADRHHGGILKAVHAVINLRGTVQHTAAITRVLATKTASEWLAVVKDSDRQTDDALRVLWLTECLSAIPNFQLVASADGDAQA